MPTANRHKQYLWVWHNRHSKNNHWKKWMCLWPRLLCAPQDLLPSHSQNITELYFPASLAARVAMWLSADQWKVQTWCAPLSGWSTDISHGWDSFVDLSGLEDPKEDCEAGPQGGGYWSRNDQVEDPLPNVKIENGETELLAEHTKNAYCVKLLRFEGCLLKQLAYPNQLRGHRFEFALYPWPSNSLWRALGHESG